MRLTLNKALCVSVRVKIYIYYPLTTRWIASDKNLSFPVICLDKGSVFHCTPPLRAICSFGPPALR